MDYLLSFFFCRRSDRDVNDPDQAICHKESFSFKGAVTHRKIHDYHYRKLSIWIDDSVEVTIQKDWEQHYILMSNCLSFGILAIIGLQFMHILSYTRSNIWFTITSLLMTMFIIKMLVRIAVWKTEWVAGHVLEEDVRWARQDAAKSLSGAIDCFEQGWITKSEMIHLWCLCVDETMVAERIRRKDKSGFLPEFVTQLFPNVDEPIGNSTISWSSTQRDWVMAMLEQFSRCRTSELAEMDVEERRADADAVATDLERQWKTLIERVYHQIKSDQVPFGKSRYDYLSNIFSTKQQLFQSIEKYFQDYRVVLDADATLVQSRLCKYTRSQRYENWYRQWLKRLFSGPENVLMFDSLYKDLCFPQPNDDLEYILSFLYPNNETHFRTLVVAEFRKTRQSDVDDVDNEKQDDDSDDGESDGVDDTQSDMCDEENEFEVID
eukprot:GILJ01025078.1.p1 GENE.GILJ01025078.1~~GILJ01025078.1.p1  ORF type:complete len:436 (+),score=46.12 GILJ01025078.1:34-1341(+)